MRGGTLSQARLFKGIHGPALRFKSCFVCPFATPNVALRLRCNDRPVCQSAGFESLVPSFGFQFGEYDYEGSVIPGSH
jgi:hypothetical protein